MIFKRKFSFIYKGGGMIKRVILGIIFSYGLGFLYFKTNNKIFLLIFFILILLFFIKEKLND